MRKVAINGTFGGFCLLDVPSLFEGMRKRGYNVDKFGNLYPPGVDHTINGFMVCREIERDNPDLIELVEKAYRDNGGETMCIQIVEIPADMEYEIGNYDGWEWISEKHRRWYSADFPVGHVWEGKK